MLIILGGLPGTGKSTIGKELSSQLQAVYLRIDSIEQALKDAYEQDASTKQEVVAEGYMAAYAIAKDNLEIGHTVIADSVNSIEVTRSDWRKVASSLNKEFIEIEVICSDKSKHQKRVETRVTNIQGLKLPTWNNVLNRDYEPWKNCHLTIDTSKHSLAESVGIIIDYIKDKF